MGTKVAAKVLILFAIAVTVSSKLEVYQPPHEFKQIENDNQSGNITICHLYCKVRHYSDNNGTSENSVLINEPYVHWEKMTKQSPKIYHPLRNVLFWYEQEKISFIHSLRYYCSNRKEVDRNVYDCGITIEPCTASYIGDYRCSVFDFDSGSKVDRSFELRLDDKDSNKTCYMPKAENITAQLIEGENGVHLINVTWDYRGKPRGYKKYCDSSRQWQIRSFNSSTSYSFEDGREPVQSQFTQVPFQNTAHKRDTYFTFQISNAERNNYFQFQIQNKRRKNDLDVYIASKYNSTVYTFKRQIPASLISPRESGSVVSVPIGGSVELRCESAGLPEPTVYLLKNVFDISRHKLDSYNGTSVKKIKRIEEATQSDAGVYVCLASNYLVGPPQGKRRITDWKTIILEVNEHQRLDISNKTHCNSYTGSICSGYIRDDIDVYIDGEAIQGNYSVLLSRAASKISEIRRLYAAKSNNRTKPDLLNKCKRLAEAMACHTVFPYCNPKDGNYHPTPRPICKSTCDAFRAGGICESFMDNQTFPGLLQRLTSDCDERENPAGESPECIPVSVEQTRQRTDYYENNWCQYGNGRSYNGFVQRTESGLDCQVWQSQAPHKHPYTPSTNLELERASGYCRNPHGVGERPWCYTTSGDRRWEYCHVSKCEVCMPYRHGFCSAVPGYSNKDSSVYVNREKLGLNPLPLLELQMKKTYNNVTSSEATWSPGCDFALKQFICHTTLPFCSDTQGEPEAMNICSDQCQLLRVIQFCSVEVYQQLVAKGSKLSLPLCSASTSAMMTNSGRSCMPSMHILTTEDHHRHVQCYNISDLGQSYTGYRAVTWHGKPCRSWSEPYPLFNASLYPELNGAENFCRNPGRLRERPWCFTAKNEWDYCDLPTNCTDIPPGGRSPASPSSGGNLNQNIIPVVFTVIVALVVVVSVVVSVVSCRHYKIKQARSTPPPLPLSLQHVKKYPSDMKMIENDNYVPLPKNKMAVTIKKFHELDRQMEKASIKYIRQIGQGNFGVVFQGKIVNLLEDEEETVVAVKTLKDDCQEALEDFAREAKIMLQFDHPNIIKLYGVCTEELPYYLVFEYMDQGDLARFLRQNASSEQRRLLSTSSRHRSRTDSTISDDPASLTPEQLTDMCKQIAKGMEYLASKDHVHRDLACRNCLVKTCLETGMTDSGFIIKIGDFGMSHDLYQRNYYRVQGQAILPVRWMSPEAVIYGKFSTAGDVWSFGVTMWEVFSFAMQPYYGITNEEVTKLIRTGKHLEKPYDCPRNTYEIMKQCWSQEPMERPTFSDLYTMLNTSRMSVSSEESAFSSSDSSSQSESDLDSDAFLEENSIDGVFLDVTGESQA